jgi:hypothetical protein
MTVIMLMSVVLDRQALTMRNLALAACLVNLLEPYLRPFVPRRRPPPSWPIISMS